MNKEQQKKWDDSLELLATIIEQSKPGCGLKKECYTECGKCGAERILNAKDKNGNPIFYVTDSDQSKPKLVKPLSATTEENSLVSLGYLEAQQDMSDFKRVIKEEE